jgi:hypothetical protein
VVLLGLGGLGLGTTFSSVLTYLTTAATPRYAPDISGVFTTTLQIAGAVGVATFGTAYLGLATHGDPTHAFAVVTAAFAGVALLGAATARQATLKRETQPAARPPRRARGESRRRAGRTARA